MMILKKHINMLIISLLRDIKQLPIMRVLNSSPVIRNDLKAISSHY